MTDQFDSNQRPRQLLPQLPKDLNRGRITGMATSPRIDLRPGVTDPVVLMISRRQVEAFDIASVTLGNPDGPVKHCTSAAMFNVHGGLLSVSSGTLCRHHFRRPWRELSRANRRWHDESKRNP